MPARATKSEYVTEKAIEKPSVAAARLRGWFVRKYKGPGRRSHPDDLFAKGGVIFWVEFKRPGKEPTELQWIEIRAMQAAGLDVVWLSDRDDFMAVLRDRESRLLQRD
jgi:hypothetical protein